MGISTSRLCDRRAYRGTIDGEYRMRSPSAASRSRTRGWRTATGPMPVMISRCGRWPWRTTRCRPVSVLRSVCFARNSATSASTAWVSSARAPLRRISVRESAKAPGWASLMTLLSDTAYHSFIGEVEALNTTTIRRLTRSRCHQLLAIAQFGKVAMQVFLAHVLIDAVDPALEHRKEIFGRISRGVPAHVFFLRVNDGLVAGKLLPDLPVDAALVGAQMRGFVNAGLKDGPEIRSVYFWDMLRADST